MAVEGRKLTFKVALHDEKGPVGGGTHERFVINNAKFAAKAVGKEGVKLLPSSLRDATVPLFVAYTTSSPGRGKSFSMREALAVR